MEAIQRDSGCIHPRVKSSEYAVNLQRSTHFHISSDVPPSGTTFYFPSDITLRIQISNIGLRLSGCESVTNALIADARANHTDLEPKGEWHAVGYRIVIFADNGDGEESLDWKHWEALGIWLGKFAIDWACVAAEFRVVNIRTSKVWGRLRLLSWPRRRKDVVDGGG